MCIKRYVLYSSNDASTAYSAASEKATSGSIQTQLDFSGKHSASLKLLHDYSSHIHNFLLPGIHLYSQVN